MIPLDVFRLLVMWLAVIMAGLLIGLIFLAAEEMVHVLMGSMFALFYAGMLLELMNDTREVIRGRRSQKDET